MLRKSAVLMLCCASLSWACPKGSTEWRDGVCAAEIKAEGVSPEESNKWRSDEKAPGKGHQPDWETGKVTAANAPSMVKHDEEWDASVKKEMDSVGKPVSTTTFKATATTTSKGTK